MNCKIHSILIFLLLLALPRHGFAQDEQWTAADKRLIENLRAELKPDPILSEKLQSLVGGCAEEVAKLESEKSRLNQESSDDAMLAVQLKVINQQIKDLREERDLAIQAELNPDQLEIYTTRIKPAKPQVLHFGLHNRADCNVCKE